MILELDANLSHYAGVIKKSLRIDVNRVPGLAPRAAWAQR